jgi:hypothetical protein
MLLFKERPWWRFSWQLSKIGVLSGPQAASEQENQGFLIQGVPMQGAA